MSDSFQQLARLFERVRHLRRDAREDYLAEECGDDTALREEVEELLAHMDAEDGFSERALERIREQIARVAGSGSTHDAQRASASAPGERRVRTRSGVEHGAERPRAPDRSQGD